jgi:hypothetical protein
MQRSCKTEIRKSSTGFPVDQHVRLSPGQSKLLIEELFSYRFQVAMN